MLLCHRLALWRLLMLFLQDSLLLRKKLLMLQLKLLLLPLSKLRYA